MGGIKGINLGNINGFKKGMISLNKGKTKENGLYPNQCGFQKGHLPFGGAIKGRLKGQKPHNKGTSVWLECKCQECGSSFKIRKCHSRRGRGKYCSKECFIKSLKGRIPKNKLPREIRTCFCGCGLIFECSITSSKKFFSKECANKYRKGKKREPFTEEHKRKIGKGNKGNGRWGEQSNHWKGGITSFYNLLRTLDEYNEWRMNCLKRDWFKCRECSSKKNLEVHHIISFQKLINEFLQKYNQFSFIDDREILIKLARTYESFWDINNGITLCELHHKSLSRSKI